MFAQKIQTCLDPLPAPRPSNLTAYEIALRARAHALEGYDKTDRVLIDQSIREAKDALAIDPSCVPALLAPQPAPDPADVWSAMEWLADRQDSNGMIRSSA